MFYNCLAADGHLGAQNRRRRAIASREPVEQKAPGWVGKRSNHVLGRPAPGGHAAGRSLYCFNLSSMPVQPLLWLS